MRVAHQTYNHIFSVVYAGMMSNVLLTVAFLPVLLLLSTTNPAATWPALAVLALLGAPALVAVFAVFAELSNEGRVAVVRVFARSWRRSLRPALVLGAVATFALVVLSVDIAAAGRSHVGAIAIPLLLALELLVIATALLAFVGLAASPSARLRDLVRPAVYLAVRRWYFTAVSLFAIGLLGGVVAVRPAIGLGFAAAPLLYVVWANGRFTMRPVLPDEKGVTT